LLAAGINVVTSINLQYIEELRASVEHITESGCGNRPPELHSLADEIEIVDVPPEQLLERIGRQPDEQSAAASAGACRNSAKWLCSWRPRWSTTSCPPT